MAKGCPKGFVRRNGRCVPAPKRRPRDVAPGIPGVQVRNPAGRAGRNLPGEGINNPPGRGPANPRGACPTGYVWDVATKRCVRRRGSDAKPREGCPPGYFWDASVKRCRKEKADPGGCPAGYTWNGRQGRCVQDKTCPEGMVFRNGKCEFPDQGYCPDGYHLENGQCVRNEQGDCPPGYVWDNGRCVIDPDAETAPETEAPEGAPPMPTSQLPPGWSWEWNDDSQQWEAVEGEVPTEFDNDLMAYVTDLLSQYGLDTPGLLQFTRTAIAQGWSQAQIMLELRKHPDYLANPLFAANVERAKAGGGWMAEGQIIAYANETKRLAKQYGYGEPSDNYIAQNIQGGRSLAEFEHRVQIQRNVENYGPAVRMLMEDYLGHSFDDNDLYELFDPEIDTEEWSRAFKDAMYRGRPFALGLGVRSQAEADALRLLGVDPDEAFQRYGQVAQNASRFDRLATIEGTITGNLPADFGSHLAKADNSLLVRALVFNDSAALAQLQEQTAREIARFQTGGGAVSSQGQAIGLLSGAERATFG